ncbi:MAG: choice-of-anchor Q domain-containing protein [Bacteroidota bacterium]
MKKSFLFIVNILFILGTVSNMGATNYYSDPVNGNMSNDGSEGNPWAGLQDIFVAGKVFNAGDTIFLLSGAHGEPYISGTHSDYVTIKAAIDENPKLASVQMGNGSYWAFDGINFTSDGSGGNFTRNYMFIANTDVSYLKVENCNFYSAENSDTWTKADWYANAVNACEFRGGNIIFQNNIVKNVYHAVSFWGDYSDVKNNVIENFGADAIRALSSNSVYENNTIKNAYIEDYNVNHDDAIQMYDADNVAAGIIENVIIRNNIINFFEKPVTQAMFDDNLVGYSMQGIFITDGHAENVIVENNLVVSDTYHGITLIGAVDCRVQNNTVLKTSTSVNPTADAIPWIQLTDDKQGNESINNVIRNNLTTKLTPWTYPDAQNTTENNIEITTINYINYFIDAGNFNFQLKEPSPAIDAGVNTDLTSIDLAGNQRLSGYLVDCGAYEYQYSIANNAPVLTAIGNQTTTEVASDNISISATDADGDALTFSATNLPSFATLTDNDDGTADIALAAQIGDAGSYTDIVVTVSDGTDTDTETISITVNPAGGNSAPVLDAIGDQTLTEGEIVDVNVSASDIDGEALIFTAANLPSFATLTDNGNGTAILRLVPKSGDYGNYTNIRITVSDGVNEDTETFDIVVSQSTGIESIKDSKIHIYPNPAIEGDFNIKLQERGVNSHLKIYSVKGALVYSKKLNNKIEFINANLKADIYIVQIYSNGNIYYKKLIVN